MSLKAELTTWAAALKAYEADDMQSALLDFEKIADTSKVNWNMGIILATIGRHEEAIDRFYEATSLDMYMTVGYHQAGVSNFMLGQYEAAQKDFEDALLYLRGNQTIDYTQLGLAFRLHSCEVLFNCGLSKIYLGQFDSGISDLREAAGCKQTAEHGVIDDAIRDQGRDYNVFSVPVGVLFRPSAKKLKNLETRDYMGKAILVAASDATDAYTTFTGITRLQRGQNPSGAPLEPGTALGRSASVSQAAPMATPVQARMARSNTVAAPRQTEPLTMGGMGGGGPKPGLGRSTTQIRPTVKIPEESAPIIPLPAPLRQPSFDSSSSSSPQSVPEPLIQTPQQERPSKSLRVTELYDDYYRSPGAFDDDIPPDLPPIGGKKIEQWAKGTPFGASPSAPLSRKGSASASIARAPPSAFQRGPSLRRMPSIAGTESSYRDDASEVSSFYDMVKIRVKVHYRNLKRGMSVSPEQTFDDFMSALEAKFPEMSGGGGVQVRFKDEDGDELSMQDEGDFEAAVDVARVLAKGRAEGKLEIWVE
ncbi:hypothetical protein B9479_006778 [Cryptococcus floricola]|uniref:PB1 domain-containing protein n=1 Tax=Cryptococcus floricola TaxID=2591691 RepID=A0A5D3API3_9TREE|nr:hypothetical protein B9479_006778 [Cryptococcus floricola]